MKKFISFSFLFFFFFACSSSKQVAIKQTAASDLKQQVVSVWKGIIPCADCPGIEYRLHLKRNDSFEERMEYLERNVKPFRTEGTWQISSDSIITLKDKEIKSYILFKNGYLEMLDGEGKPIQSTLAEHYRLTKIQ